MQDDFDFVIVGAGTAGCVLAARLAASGAHRVLLIEAGGEDSSPWIHVPVGYAKLMGDARYNWLYRTAPEPELGGRELEQPCGRVIGGTGSINGMLHVQGQPEDYDGWRALGNEGWGWNDVRPWFARLELPVSAPPQRHPLADAFVDAAAQAGHPRNDGFNGATQEGAGYYKLNTRHGRRASTSIVYLRPARELPNLVVAKQALATRILFEEGVASGVEYRQGTLKRVRARREVIVAGGTFNSPQLLQVSGIGAGERLHALGIPVVRDLPGVGENLQNHYRASIVARCAQPVTMNDDMRSLWRRIGMGMRYALFRDGPLAAGTYAGGFFRTDRGAARPDLQMTFWTYSVEKRGAAGVVLHPFAGFTANAVLLRPQSRGWVRAKSADAAAAPEIRYNHLAEDYDRRTLLAGMRLVRDVLARPALAPFHAGELAPGPECMSDDALLAYARDKGNSVYHPVGTCAMGSVVDARLRVRGVGRLRVADASVMPAIPSGNTNTPTAMIAERAADWILKDAF